jgi:hypothetical protein
MGGDLFRRGAAIGAALGLGAAAATVHGTPAALRSDPTGALELAALFVSVYAAVGLAAVPLLGAVARGLGAARALWPLALLGVAFAFWNEAARTVDAVAPWRIVGRVALGAAAIAALWRSVAAPRAAGPFARRVETALAVLLVPAALGVAGFYRRPLPSAAAEAAPEAVLALAPRFAPEPRAAFAHVGDPDRPRVLLIGVDGASWDRLDRGIASGALPTFALLRAIGVHAPLRSDVPTYSPRLWTSIATGVRAEQHGVESFYLYQLPRLGIDNLQLPRSVGLARAFLERTGELGFVPATSSLRRRKAIWNLADEAGLGSAVIGLWATWPPESLAHGVVVSDHASLARQQEWMDRGKTSEGARVTTWPPALAASLAPLQRTPDSVTREELGAFVALDDETWRAFESVHRFSKEVPLSAFRSSHLNDAFYARAAEQIWRERRPDFLFVYLRAVDELSHFFYEAGVPEAGQLGWSDADRRRFAGVVDSAYAATDRAIAPLVQAALESRDTLVVVVSDHGWVREPSGRYNHNYAPPGILLVAGAGVCARDCASLGKPSIYDVAPTVLERLGLPLSGELVGRPLREAFAAPRETTRVAAYGAPLGASRAIASGADAEMREKLEALGYVRR